MAAGHEDRTGRGRPRATAGPTRLAPPGAPAWEAAPKAGPCAPRAVASIHPFLPPPSLNPRERAAAFRRWGPRGPEKTRLLLRGHICGAWGPQARRRNFVSTRKGSGRCGDRGRGGEPGAWHAEAGPREPGGPAGVLSPGSPAAGKAARCAVVLGAGSPPTRFQDPEQQATRLRPRGRGPRRHRPPPPRQLRRAAGPGHPGTRRCLEGPRFRRRWRLGARGEPTAEDQRERDGGNPRRMFKGSEMGRGTAWETDCVRHSRRQPKRSPDAGLRCAPGAPARGPRCVPPTPGG